MFHFPQEIVEKILYYCDGKTLKNAKLVHPDWNDAVEFLTKTTKIWKWCCVEEIPQNELVNYSEKFEDYDDENKWINIYYNWNAWQNIEENIRFDTILCPFEVPRITYVAVSGPYIAVGSEDGRIKIFEESGGLLHTARYQAVKIKEITFMNEEEKDDPNVLKKHILLAYKTGSLILTQFDGKFNHLIEIQDVTQHSVYKKYLCYEKRGAQIIISKLCKDVDGDLTFCEITFLRIYSPNELLCLHMWNGFVTFLVGNEVKVFRYDKNNTAVNKVANKMSIEFCLKTYPGWNWTCHIYRDNIIICSSGQSCQQELLELFILGEGNKYSKKLFNSWDALQAIITCMFLYGNIFVMGVDTGNVYFYYVPCWMKFDIRNYQKKCIIGRHPIIGIDVKEIKQERKFYIASSFNVHKVVSFNVTDG